MKLFPIKRKKEANEDTLRQKRKVKKLRERSRWWPTPRSIHEVIRAWSTGSGRSKVAEVDVISPHGGEAPDQQVSSLSPLAGGCAAHHLFTVILMSVGAFGGRKRGFSSGSGRHGRGFVRNGRYFSYIRAESTVARGLTVSQQSSLFVIAREINPCRALPCCVRPTRAIAGCIVRK